MPDEHPDDGYSAELAAYSDKYYGDGLAWLPAVEASTDFFAQLRPDLVTFQEIFWSENCADIPSEAWTDFVCSQWWEGEPTVAQRVLGDGRQVACHPGKPDKCAAVNEDFGTFSGCDGGFCLEGLEGYELDGCGSGARVARGTVEPVFVEHAPGSPARHCPARASSEKRITSSLLPRGGPSSASTPFQPSRGGGSRPG